MPRTWASPTWKTLPAFPTLSQLRRRAIFRRLGYAETGGRSIACVLSTMLSTVLTRQRGTLDCSSCHCLSLLVRHTCTKAAKEYRCRICQRPLIGNKPGMRFGSWHGFETPRKSAFRQIRAARTLRVKLEVFKAPFFGKKFLVTHGPFLVCQMQQSCAVN